VSAQAGALYLTAASVTLAADGALLGGDAAAGGWVSAAGSLAARPAAFAGAIGTPLNVSEGLRIGVPWLRRSWSGGRRTLLGRRRDAIYGPADPVRLDRAEADRIARSLGEPSITVHHRKDHQ
jgi:hypothetical protein